MSKMKRLMEDMVERETEITQVLSVAHTKRPAFYEMVEQTPSMKTVTSLLRGITDDQTLILLVTGYLSSQIKS